MSDHMIEKLKDKFKGSWAIWSEEFPEDGCIEEKVGKGQKPEAIYELIKKRKDEIKPNIVLLGLNPSGSIKPPYENFHSTHRNNNDDKLKKFIQDNDLQNIKGAYMTDLQKEENEPDSNKTEDPTQEDFRKLYKELELLEQDKYNVICFGRELFEFLKKEFNKKSISKIGKSIDDYCEEGENSEIKKFNAQKNDKELTIYRVWHYSNYGKWQCRTNELEEQLKFLNEKEIAKIIQK